jgi:hypothetical protein
MPSPVCYTLSSHSLLVLMGDQTVLYCAYILTPIPFSPSHYLPQLNIIYPSPYCVPCPLRLLISPPFCAFFTSPWRQHHLIPPYSYVLYFICAALTFAEAGKERRKSYPLFIFCPPPPLTIDRCYGMDSVLPHFLNLCFLSLTVLLYLVFVKYRYCVHC